MSLLETENLAVGYNGQALIEDINIAGEEGILLCILGPNGAGKTTILRSISGLLSKIGGEVYINGRDLSIIDARSLAKEVSLVLTQKFDGGMMTVFELVSMGRYPYTGFFGKLGQRDIDKIQEALRLVNGQDLIDRFFSQLSDGEKQKVLIARALVQEPDLIILDEPTSHLDIRHRLELVEILKKLAREKKIGVILSLHEIDLALKSCDKVLLVNEREVQAYGLVEEVVDEAIISQLYGLEEASFNNLLGSIELRNRFPARIFVLAGGGTGLDSYRLLTKNNLGFKTGVIHRNDLDYQVARSMGVDLVGEDPFRSFTRENLALAQDMIDSCDYVLDTNPPLGEINQGMIDLFNYSLDQEKTIISLRPSQEAEKYYRTIEDIIFLDNISAIGQIIKERE